jgi:hypothetical protein
MAKKPNAETAAAADDKPAAIDPAAYYFVEASSRFRFSGAGFGPLSRTEVTGAILLALLASDVGGKVASYSKV